MTTGNRGKYVLITNLDYVFIQDVRLYCHALLISENRSLLSDGVARSLRGFLTDASAEVFDMRIPSIEHTLVSGKSRDVFVGSSGEPRPLFTGATLKIADVIDIQLICGSSKIRQDLDVHKFPDNTDITEVWDELPKRVARHWSAPNMPMTQWLPSALMKIKLGVG